MPIETKNNIVVLDSMKDFAETVVDCLSRYGFNAVTMDRADLEKYMEGHPVDLVTTDLRSINDADDHDLSGLTLARNLEIPVIILTAARGLPQGNTLPENARFLGKSAGYKELLQTVKELLYSSQS